MKKIISITVCIMLLMTILPFVSSAGDEENPEIEDGEKDLEGFFGMLFPRFFKHIDLISGWFYENSSQPDYLFFAMKVKDLEYKKQRAIYSIHWEHKGIQCFAGFHTDSFGDFFIAFAGYYENGNETFYEIDAFFDRDNDIITMNIPKEYIRNPQPEDLLESLFAWNAVRFVSDKLSQLYTRIFGESELAKDWAFGEDYTIQF